MFTTSLIIQVEPHTMSLQGFGHFIVFILSISMKTMEKCGGFALYNYAENVPVNEKENQLEVPRARVPQTDRKCSSLHLYSKLTLITN